MKTKNQELLKKLNEAFAKNDADFVVQQVTDNIKWTAIGDFSIEGKEAFTQTLKEMISDEPSELEIHNIITHGRDAAVNGLMKSTDGKQYAFCDVYKFSGFKDPKISEMTSYAIEVKS
jgi:hypothetical protein